MNPSERTAAQEQSLLMPATIQVGPYTVRLPAGGDILLARRLGLILASGDPDKIAKMTGVEQTEELTIIGALLCYPESEIKKALWKGVEFVREEMIGDLLFKLTPAQTAELIEAVARTFELAGKVAHEVEPKPKTDDSGPQPTGK